ncbi:MAG: hypothetical protein LBG71_02160 [Clostridiales Family XIII bacterium]|nr:hypothetical protein [Clostridiales Family XIII bacterium]
MAKEDRARGKAEGVSTVRGGTYDEFDVNGVCTVLGPLEAGLVSVNGVCTCESDVTARHLDCKGVLTIHGNARAGEMDVEGVVSVGGAKLEADHIRCEGLLTVKGEISADVIEADGKISAREIVGDRIVIKSFWRRGLAKLLFGIGRRFKMFEFSEVELIEATTVELQYVKAVSVSGRDVTVGRECEIERVDCCGKLKIDPTAKVGEISGDYVVV